MKRFWLTLLLLGAFLPGSGSLFGSVNETGRSESTPGEVLAQSETDKESKESRRDRWKNRDRRKERPDRGWDSRNPENSRVERLRMRKIMETLQLNDDQREFFMPLFMKMRRVRREAAKEHRLVVRQLSDGLQDQTLADGDIEKMLTAVHALDDKSREDENRFIDEARKILTVQQWARLVVFQDRFEIETIGRLSRSLREDGGRVRPDSGHRREGRPEFRKFKRERREKEGGDI